MVTKVKALTREQKQAERLAQIGWEQQMQLAHESERAEQQKAHDEFAQKVQRSRDAIDSHIKRSWAQRSDEIMTPRQMASVRAEIEQAAFEQVRVEGGIPTLGSIYAAKAAEEAKAAEAAEAARIAALNPRDVLISTLPVSKKTAIERWENANKGQQFPLEALPYL